LFPGGKSFFVAAGQWNRDIAAIDSQNDEAGGPCPLPQFFEHAGLKSGHQNFA